jgi:hypothetical protein
VYGSVKSPFIQRLADSPPGRSYFFEAASGYSVAAISAALAQRWRSEEDNNDPFRELPLIPLSGFPLAAIDFRNDTSLGRHLEVGVTDYSLDHVTGKSS